MAMLPTIFDNTALDDVFSDPFFTQPVPQQFTAMTAPTSMNTDIKETDKGYELAIDMPGFNKDEVKVEVKNGYLNVTGSHTENKDEKGQDGKYLRRERYSGSTSRSYYVGDSITSKDVHAKYENGTLTLSLPKVEDHQVEDDSHRVAIEG